MDTRIIPKIQSHANSTLDTYPYTSVPLTGVLDRGGKVYLLEVAEAFVHRKDSV
jgi:hypothetical protein